MPPSAEPPVDLVACADPVAAFRDADRSGRAVLLRSSGSASSPRPVVRSPGSWTRSFPHVRDLAGIGPASRVLVPGPVASSMNLFARVQAAYAGATVLDRWLADAPPTHVVLTPAGLDRLLTEDRDGPGAASLDGLVAVVAGDGLSPGLHGRATGRGMVVHHYYGAAELSFVAWGRHADDLRAFPEVEVEARGGEVWVRSPYLCDARATSATRATRAAGAADAFRRDADGFATVGDRGRLEHGTLRLAGRPDAVTTGGATVLVADVEAALRPHARGDVLVTGLPHAALGRVVAAVLSDPADLDALVRESRTALPAPARPRLWFHLPAPPVTGAGKVDRARLADVVAAAGRRLPTVRDQRDEPSAPGTAAVS